MSKGKFFLFLSFLCLFPLFAWAQPGNCTDPADPLCNPPEPVPLTGIEWVIGAGILLGGGYLAKRRPKPEEE